MVAHALLQTSIGVIPSNMSDIDDHTKEQAINQLTNPANSLSDVTDTEKKDTTNAPSTFPVADWDGPNDPDNPHNWPLWQRIYHATTPGFFGFAV